MAGFGAKVKLTVDKSSKAEFNQQINSMIGKIKISNNFVVLQKDMTRVANEASAMLEKTPIKVKKIDCSAAVNDMRKQLQGMIDSLSIKNGVAITGLKDPLGAGVLSTSLDATKISLEEAQAAVEKYNAQLQILKTTQQSLDSVFKSATAGNKMLQDAAQLETVKAQYDALIQRIQTFKAATEEERARTIEAARALQEKITLLQQEQMERANATAEAQRQADAEARAEQRKQDELQNTIAQYRQYYTLLTQIEHAQKTWTKAQFGRSREDYAKLGQYANDLKAAFAALQANPASVKTIREFNDLVAKTGIAFADTTNSIKANEEATRSWSSRLGTLSQKFTAWLSVSQIIMLVIRSIRKMITAVNDLDAALTQIEIVTHTSGAALDSYADSAADVASRIGSTVTDVIKSTETYARLGNTLEDSLTLADVTGRYANVAATTIDEATSSLTSIMKAFQIAPKDMEGIVDMLVKVGQEYAISAGELGEAMQHAGSALEAGGNTVEQAIALMAAGNAAVQDASVVGNALKTTTLRIRSSTAELEEMGETVDDLVKSASKYRAEIKALSGVDIMLDDENYKSTYQILKEIAAVWDHMTDIKQASLLEDLAGKRNANVVKSIITNLNDLEGAYEAANNAAGTLAEANDVYMQSTQAHIAQFKVAFTELANTLIGSDFVKEVVDFGTTILNILNTISSLIDKLGGLNTVLYVTIGLISIIKADAIKAAVFGAASKLIALISGAPSLIAKLATATQIFITMIRQSSAATSTAIAVAGQSTGVFGMMSASLKAVGISASAAQIAMTGLVAAVGIAMFAFSKYKQSVEEARQAAQDSFNDASAALEQAAAIRSAYSEYAVLSNKVNRTAQEEDALKEAVDKVNNALSSKSDILRTLTGDTEEYAEAVRNAMNDELTSALASAREERDAAEDLLKGLSYSGWDGSQITIDLSGRTEIDEFVSALETAKDVMGEFIDNAEYLSSNGQLEPIGWDEDHANMDAVVAYYYKLLELKEKLALQNNMDNDIYDRATDITQNLKTAVEQYVKAKLDEVSVEYELAHGIPATIDELDEYREHLNDTMSSIFNFDGSDTVLSGIIEDYIGSLFPSLSSGADKASEQVDKLSRSLMSLSDQLAKLDALQEKVESLSAAFADMAGDDDNKAVSFESLSKIAEQFADVSDIDNYISRIAALRDDTEALTDVMNELLGAYISQKLAAGDLADADEEVIEAMLWEAGVANADEAAHQLLIDAKDRLRGETLLAEEGIDSFIDSLADETAYSAAARSSLLQLAAQMVKTNNTKMDFSQQLAQLGNIGKAAGVSAATLAYYAHVQEAIANGTVEGFRAINNAEQYINDFVNEINAAASNVQFKFDFSGATRNNSSGRSSGAKTATKEIEEYIVAIDRFREAQHRLDEATSKREGIQTQLERNHSLVAEKELREQLTQAIFEEQEAMHSLNEERDAAIHESIDKLNDLGFNVEYDDISNKFWVTNLEHINELTGSTKEKTNELRKSTEELISTLESWNASNADTSSDWWDRYAEKIQNVIDLFERMTGFFENRITLTENWLDNAIDEKDFDSVRKYADNIAAYYAEMQRNIHKQAEYYRSLGYDDESDEVSKLSDLWWEYEKKRVSVSIDAWDKIVQAAHESVDKLQDVYDRLHDAANEYAANGGFISIDTLQSIIQLGAQYMQFLEDQNGLLTITDEKINKILAAKTEELALEQALAYIEQLRMALRDNKIEQLNNLLYATTETTGATWELVYAQLALLGLDDKQYQAALHNINALRSLAYTAMQGIGQVADKTKDELTDMKSGLDDLLKYVMEMLKYRVNEQIKLLEEMKDRYAEIVRLKKESLRASKDEADYQKKVSNQVKEIAKLQARIDALSLDTSREAQAKRAQLLEELAEKQDNLADDQAEHAIDATEKNLDEQQKMYEEEKDAEIKILEDSISSTEKLYRMAIDYIRENWATLRDELIQWNYDVGTNFQYEIEQAWEAALAAAQRYGDYVTALANIDADIASASGNTHNDIVSPNYDHDTDVSNDTMVSTIVSYMKALSSQWNKANDKETNDRLHAEAAVYAAKLDQYGVHADFDGKTGAWTITRDVNHPGNVGKLLYNVYHHGGIAGDKPTLKQNEVLAKLEEGEAILDQKKQDGLYRIIDFTSAISEKLSKVLQKADIGSMFKNMKSSVEAMQDQALGTVNNSKTNSINFGDTYVYGASEETAERYRAIKREQANEVLNYLGIRK